MSAPDCPAGCETGLRAQFGRPAGLAGWLVGHVMALKNRRRGRWVVSLLALRPGLRVLEVGFGPGVDVRRAAALGAIVHGVDPSAEMVRQASRRNGRAAAVGRVALRRGEAGALPFEEGTFDVVFASNSVQFWRDLPLGLAEARRVLRPGGLLAVAIQPRDAGATAATTDTWEARLRAALEAAGLVGIRAERLALRVPAVCVLGRRPGGLRCEPPEEARGLTPGS